MKISGSEVVVVVVVVLGLGAEGVKAHHVFWRARCHLAGRSPNFRYPPLADNVSQGIDQLIYFDQSRGRQIFGQQDPHAESHRVRPDQSRLIRARPLLRRHVH